jgi:peptidyl-prolyl cis-trans isomerase SurA
MAVLLVAPSVAPAAVNGISAVVSDSVITQDDVEALTAQTADVILRDYRRQPELLEKKMIESRKENLKQLINRKMILQEFKTAFHVPEEVIDKDVERIIQVEIRNTYGSRMKMIKTLQARGTTYERYKQTLKERFLVDQMRQANVTSEIIISPFKIETYYKSHLEEFKLDDQVKLRIIVLNRPRNGETNSVRAQAEEILSQLNSGASFSDMAATYSQGSQKGEGGDWGWQERKVLRQELADAAAKLKAGERSGVIETPDSYYLMLVEEVKPAHYKPLTEVREQVEKTLEVAERRRIEKEWLANLEKKTFIRYF